MADKTKKWTNATLYIPYDKWDEVQLYLYSKDIYTFELIDPRYEMDSEDLETWLYFDKEIFKDEYDGITVKIYKETGDRIDLNNVKSYIEDNSLAQVTIDTIDDSDWANNWKIHHKVQEIGERFAIVPSWEKYENSQDRKIITLDAGMAFGTGDHETTKLMLEFVEKYITPNMSVLDIGTGSGILAIAAKKLGASKVLGTDLDSSAVEVAKENAKINDVSCDFVVSDLLDNVRGQYDLVLANIVAEIIELILDDLDSVLNQGGTFICSGITDKKIIHLEHLIKEKGFKIIDSKKSSDWNALVIRRDMNV